MNITENAQERVNDILINSDQVFRVALEGGGCTGFKYVFDITDTEEDDIHISENVVTDQISMMYFQGATLDYKYDFFSQSFVVNNPNVKTTCGCGESIGF